MSERHIELTWRCRACAHRNLGRHLECAECGKAKDSEEYEMPSDTTAAESVTDERLLRIAKSGANWRCVYCGSDQRDVDGGCARCGAGRKVEATAPIRYAPRTPIFREPRFWTALLGIAVIGSCAVCVKEKHRERPAPIARVDFAATVTAVAWTTTVTVERRELRSHEGFAAEVPADAVDVEDAGVHFHHDEQVFDHDETVYDDVEVPDGTRTETYSERVACGQTCTPSTRSCHQVCTTRAQTCREVCTNKKNGFASCHQECSGGGQSCHDECTGSDGHCDTKYCDETRTRSVPKTRTEKRPRIEKRYRTEPRTAPWARYELWEWVPERNVVASGDDTTPTWPDAGPLAEGDAGAGAERATTKEELRVVLALDDGSTRTYTPTSDAELAAFTVGAKKRVRVVGGELTVLGDGD